jgi:hypothetical protein
VQPEHIPQQLRRCAQWICWRYVDRGEGKKPDKQPVNPHSSHKRLDQYLPLPEGDLQEAYARFGAVDNLFG